LAEYNNWTGTTGTVLHTNGTGGTDVTAITAGNIHTHLNYNYTTTYTADRIDLRDYYMTNDEWIVTPDELIKGTLKRFLDQKEVLEDDSKVIVVTAPRQYGKSTLLVKKAMLSTGNILMYTSSSNMAHCLYDYLREECERNTYGYKFMKQDMRVDFPNKTIRVLNARTPNGHTRGQRADLVLVDNVDTLNKEQWDAILTLTLEEPHILCTTSKKSLPLWINRYKHYILK
jgi:hypothetical protein